MYKSSGYLLLQFVRHLQDKLNRQQNRDVLEDELFTKDNELDEKSECHLSNNIKSDGKLNQTLDAAG